MQVYQRQPSGLRLFFNSIYNCKTEQVQQGQPQLTSSVISPYLRIFSPQFAALHYCCIIHHRLKNSSHQHLCKLQLLFTFLLWRLFTIMFCAANGIRRAGSVWQMSYCMWQILFYLFYSGYYSRPNNHCESKILLHGCCTRLHIRNTHSYAAL